HLPASVSEQGCRSQHSRSRPQKRTPELALRARCTSNHLEFLLQRSELSRPFSNRGLRDVGTRLLFFEPAFVYLDLILKIRKVIVHRLKRIGWHKVLPRA